MQSWIVAIVFITLYISMAFSARLIFKFLQSKSECDDEASSLECDGQIKRLLAIFMTFGLSLIIINWLVLWYSPA